jgi:hypothetical protein
VTRGAAALGLWLAASPAVAAGPQPLERISQIGPWFMSCWRSPFELPVNEITEVTVRFMLKRDGAVFGEPRISYSTPGLPEQVRDTYKAAVFRMLADCAPAPVSEGLGAAVAGRIFFLRVIHRNDQSPRSS